MALSPIFVFGRQLSDNRAWGRILVNPFGLQHDFRWLIVNVAYVDDNFFGSACWWNAVVCCDESEAIARLHLEVELGSRNEIDAADGKRHRSAANNVRDVLHPSHFVVRIRRRDNSDGRTDVKILLDDVVGEANGRRSFVDVGNFNKKLPVDEQTGNTVIRATNLKTLHCRWAKQKVTYFSRRSDSFAPVHS